MLKKLIILPALLLFCLIFAGGCGEKQLRIYTPCEYFSPEVIDTFEKFYGVKISVDYYNANETLYSKLEAGAVYDILIPSDYMIERLAKEGYLEPLNKRKLTNLSKIDPALLQSPMNQYDPLSEYSVPYSWGSVGLIYNPDKISESEVEEKGFDILLDEKLKGRVYLYDSERDMFMIALKSLGYSANTSEDSEIKKAVEWLHTVIHNNRPTIVTDEMIDGLINGRKDIAVGFSGDAANIISHNQNMRFFMPESGTNIWVDAIVIPRNSRNIDIAHDFIDYVLGYEASVKNAEYSGYPAANTEALHHLTTEGGMFENNEAYLPRLSYEKDEMYRDNEFLKMQLSELWFKLKN
ncbi:MAG: ABC transporter substrate-binding protein [Lachnospiraceae bacterium]|nr:ABC transporter substrate-binding protein [Lachnospiraceae bacterium]